VTTVQSITLPATDLAAHPRTSIRRHLALATLVSLALVPGIGGWAAYTAIAGAVIAPGQLVVESDVKKVQHPTGGVVGALRVREGQRVKAGEVLIRLDETQVRANLDVVLKALDELSARRARDEATRPSATAREPSPSPQPSWLAGTSRTWPTSSMVRRGYSRRASPAAKDKRRSCASGLLNCARRSPA
jgi:multidrug resistance efflux pump